MTPMNESIMKADRRGRLRYTPEQKKTMVDAYLVSGLSAPRFATLHGMNYQTLVSWIKKGKIARSSHKSQAPHPALLSLVPAEIEDSTAFRVRRSMEVFAAVKPCDMRRSFNGLHDAVSTRLMENLKSGSIYAFTTKRQTLLKILYWDGSGLWVLAKRLEKGTFSWSKPSTSSAAASSVNPARSSTPPNSNSCSEATSQKKPPPPFPQTPDRRLKSPLTGRPQKDSRPTYPRAPFHRP